MDTQAQLDHIVETGEQLFAKDPDARKAAALHLMELHRGSWEGHKPRTGSPRTEAAFRSHTHPALADAMSKETNQDVLKAFLALARELGPWNPELLRSLVERMKTIQEEDVDDLGVQLAETICRFGVPSRLVAVKQSISMDLKDRAKIVAYLIGDDTRPDCEPIYEPVLALLSASNQYQDWHLLAQIVPALQDRLPRSVLKSALVTAWQKADSTTKSHLGEALQRLGYRRRIFWWFKM